MLWTAFVLLLGCKTNEIAETIAETESPLPTPNPTIAPTPTPVVEQTEPERWVCVRKLEAPSFYTLLSKTEDGKPLYAFTNENGIVEYRVIGLIRTLTNGVITGERFAFCPADETGELAGTNPVDPDEERPGVCETLSALDLRLKKGYRLGIETGAVVSSSDYYVYGRIGNAEPSEGGSEKGRGAAHYGFYRFAVGSRFCCGERRLGNGACVHLLHRERWEIHAAWGILHHGAV